MNSVVIEETKAKIMTNKTKDANVDNPDHYKGSNGLEVIKVIEEFDLNFKTGGAVKYICRGQKKGKYLEDLKKAIKCLELEISYIERTYPKVTFINSDDFYELQVPAQRGQYAVFWQNIKKAVRDGTKSDFIGESKFKVGVISGTCDFDGSFLLIKVEKVGIRVEVFNEFIGKYLTV